MYHSATILHGLTREHDDEAVDNARLCLAKMDQKGCHFWVSNSNRAPNPTVTVIDFSGRWTARHFGSRGDTRHSGRYGRSCQGSPASPSAYFVDPVPEPPVSLFGTRYPFLLVPYLYFFQFDNLFLSCISLASWLLAWFVDWIFMDFLSIYSLLVIPVIQCQCRGCPRP